MGERKHMSLVETICLTLILIFCTPLGWIGMLCLAFVIMLLGGPPHA